MSVLDDIRAHAAECHPREACGLVAVVKGRERYFPCTNVATRADQEFMISPEDWARVEDEGEVVQVVHSHPNYPPQPSQADLVACERSGLRWLIISWPSGLVHEVAPSGYRAPLVGRTFSHGIVDCYTLIRDYYAERLNLALPDVERADGWWERGEDLYTAYSAAWGWHEVGTDVRTLREHDVLLFQVSAPVVSHAGIWLGDGTFLHHAERRLSSRDVYGGWYRKVHVRTVRHPELCA